MQINLNFLKFHFFNKNKKINNLINKNKKEWYFDKIILPKFKKSLNKIKDFDSLDDFEKNFTHFHKLNENKKLEVFNVIKNNHKSLYDDLSQYFFKENKINFYQFEIGKRERLIFTIQKKSNNKNIFIPLIFDLRHCFHINENKNYDNNSNIEKHKWDLKDKQREIKKELLNF